MMRNLLKLLIITVLSLMIIGCGGDNITDSVEETSTTTREKFPQFQTVDLTGVEVTDNIFAQKKITVMNIWGTFCPPCIDEMPELGEWARNIPNDVQIIGVVCDLNEDDTMTLETAKEILHVSDADFVNLIPKNGLTNYLKNITAVPTTIFIDNNGNITGDPIIGADVKMYQQRVKKILGD